MMQAPTLSLTEFLDHAGPIVDVRSPGEFKQGHLPGALNYPLFTDEERAQVGTAYKQVDPETAFNLGLRLFGPKMADYHEALKACAAGGPLRIHCWRGGMRSSAIAAFMTGSGTPAVTLQGGYKTFRRWVLDSLKIQSKLRVLGGYTGSGKTDILHAIQKNGGQIIDLEGLAKHRGSAYGQLPKQSQPSNEQFENLIAWDLSLLDRNKDIWIEDESRLIGTCLVPGDLLSQMHQAPLFLVDRPIEERLKVLETVYLGLSEEYLRSATQKIRRRLGDQRTDDIIQLGESGQFSQAVQLVLLYYDKAYSHSIKRREQACHTHSAKGWTHEQWASHFRSLELTHC